MVLVAVVSLGSATPGPMARRNTPPFAFSFQATKHNFILMACFSMEFILQVMSNYFYVLLKSPKY